MKNANLCIATLAAVSALSSAQAVAAETFELRGAQLAEVILKKAVPLNRVFVTPVSVEQKMGPDTVEFPNVRHCFANLTGHGKFQLEIEAGLSAEDALDSNATAHVSVLVEDPKQEVWTPNLKLSSPQAAEAGGWWSNPSSARANISVDQASDGSFQKYVVALDEVRNSPQEVCMKLEFSRGLGSVGIRSIRLVPVR